MRILIALAAMTLMSVTNAAQPATADAGVRVPTYERAVLPNGATLLLMPSHEVPLIAFHAVVRG